jgi:hypothetical protein
MIDSISVGGSTLYHADCFDVFPLIEDKSVDAIAYNGWCYEQ